MATIRSGKRQVLVIVDAQEGVVAKFHERDAVIANIQAVVAKARSAGVPVVWVQHADAELPKGSDAWRLAAGLEPMVGEDRIDKSFNSSFEGTALDDILARLGATELVLAGAATNWCIRATAYGALDRGYDLTLISDAHTTEDIELGEGRVLFARDLIADLNVAAAWLSYPGRSNRAVKAVDWSPA